MDGLSTQRAVLFFASPGAGAASRGHAMLFQANLALLAVLLCFVSASAARAQSGVELNTQGYHAYKAKNFDKALDLFKQAVNVNPENALAHYNLACVLALARAAGRVCDTNAYRSTIREHLLEAVKLASGRRKRLQEDPDLKAVHDTVWFQELLGLSAKDAKNIPKLLTKVSWYGSTGDGIFSSVVLRQLAFTEDGVVTLRTAGFTESEGPGITRGVVRGTYKVDGRKVRIEFEQEKKGVSSVYDGTLDQDGVLSFPDFDRFTDDHAECSA